MPGNNLDPFEIKGNLSVITTDNPSILGNGSIDVDGSVNTDFLGCNNINNGLIIKDIKNYTIKESLYTDTPFTGENVLYIDETDSKLKSKDSIGGITVYQPTTTKGDIIVHNGNTQVRLPVSNINNYILMSDNTLPEGIKWGVIPTELSKNVVTIIGDEKFTEIKNNLTGTFIVLIYNKISNGGSCLFLLTKNLINSPGQFVRVSGNPGMFSNNNLILNWESLQEIELAKSGNYEQEDGDYVYDFVYSDNLYSYINLLGLEWSYLDNTSIKGNYIIFISNKEHDGASAIYFLSKTNPSINTCAYIRLTSSPAPDNSFIDIKWLSNDKIHVRKTSSNYNSIYSYIDLLSLEKIDRFDITLTGISKIEILKKYQRFSGIISIEGEECNCIFSISKNIKTRSGNVSRIIGSNNGSGNLDISWGPNEGIKVYKTTLNYNGVYHIKIIGK